MQVFGKCDTNQTPPLSVMTIVPDCTATTLLLILQHHFRSGTTVQSDQWAAYNRVQQLPSVRTHNTVNQSLHFVDPATGVHTQSVESYWNRVKGKFKRMKDVNEDTLPLYIDEFMWRGRDMDEQPPLPSQVCSETSASSDFKSLFFLSTNFFQSCFSFSLLH